MTADISRHFADAPKQFRALAHQQGRLSTDAEANHAEAIDGWQKEAEFRETIAELGSPDQGFRIVPIEGDTSDFTVLGGSMYADGVRIFNPMDFDFSDQALDNWLTMSATDEVTDGARVFAWLEAEQRLVTAVEDAELLDPALRGADGAARHRICWRVRQIETDEEECLDALAEAIGPDAFALYDSEFGVIEPTGTLTAGFEADGTDLDLCKPTASGGYFGDRNATFRVKITGDGRLIWGEDNASQLYRVQLGPDADSITFLTHPRDEWQRPKTGQTVELLRGDVLLGNLEKIAEQDGALLRVTGSYDGATITINTADLPAGWDTWLAGLDPSLFAEGAERFFYLRVWTGGGTETAPDLTYTAGTPLALGATGLNVTVSGDVLPGDSWTFSARPDAPQQVLPWRMLHGMTPHSPRRFAIPLGFIELDTGDTHDCRLRFRALQRIQSCCTVTVGDGVVSRGDTDSIADAIEMLPDEGGEICLLRGEHVASIELEGASNIRFSGCKGRAAWITADEDEPALTLIDSVGIGMHGIRFEAGNVPAVVAALSDDTDPDLLAGGLAIEDCAFDAPEGYALAVTGQTGFRLVRSTIKAGPYPEAPGSDVEVAYPAAFIQGERLLVERCSIDSTISPSDNVAQRAIGGIQIGGGSTGVAIRQCTITEGTGTGIVLGSITYEEDGVTVIGTGEFAEERRPGVERALGPGYQVVQDAAGCIKVVVVPGGGETDPNGNPTRVPVSEGEVREVLIEGNTIFGMGANGIATYPLGLFGPNNGIASDAIAVDQLEISNNRIVDCRRNEVPTTPELELDQLYMPWGGVALALVSNGLFRENHIERCGSNDGSATCGIGVSYGEMLRFEDNVIFGNGQHDPAVAPVGPNSAIEVRFATGGLPTFTRIQAGLRGADKPAISIQNNMLDAPAGRAIRSLALGPVRVTDNRLIGGNPSRLLANLLGSVTGMLSLIRTLPQNMRVIGTLDAIFDLIGGDCVNIANIGVPEDIWTMLFSRGPEYDDSGEPVEDEGDSLSLSLGFFNAGLNAGFRHPLQGGGDILFTNNQVSLRRPSGAIDPVGPPVLKSGQSALSEQSIFVEGFDAQSAGIREASEPRKENDLSEAGVVEIAAGNNNFGLRAPQPNLQQSGLGTLSSIFIASLDDVYFGENQCEIESERLLSIFHALLLGLTLRTQANRMQEGAIAFRSIWAFGPRLHNAAHNQTTARSWYGPEGSGTWTGAHTVNRFNRSII